MADRTFRLCLLDGVRQVLERDTKTSVANYGTVAPSVDEIPLRLNFENFGTWDILY